MTPYASPEESALTVMKFWKEHHKFYDVMAKNNLIQFMNMVGLDFILNEEPMMLPLLFPEIKSLDTDILACFISYESTLIFQWYLRGFDTPPEEMAKKYLRVLHAPLLSTDA